MDQNKPNSAMGITGFVLGVIALVSSWVPIVNNFSFLLAILGLIFAIIGVVQTVKGTRGGKGLAIAGLIICVLSFVIVLATQGLYSAAWDKAVQDNLGSGSSSSGSQSASTDTATSDGSSGQAKYAVSIDSCNLTTDYNGAQAVIVTYTWTNNSDSDTMFSVAIGAKAFQNGVQLDSAFIGSSENYDSGAALNQIKPGATQTVQEAYKLNDQSDITVECSENFSLSDELLAQKTYQVA